MAKQIAEEFPSDMGPTRAADACGTDTRQLHQTAQEAVTYLFPKERGRLLLNALLQNAQDQEVPSADTGKGDFAVVRLESIERFARERLGWGKDTTLRYISVLEALQLVQRQRTASSSELHISLTPWEAREEILAALDALLVSEAARAKLQQLARGVRERFLLLYGTPSTHFSLIDEMIATLSDVEQLLSKRLCAKKRQLVKLRVAHLKTRLEGDAQRGDLGTLGGFAGQGDRSPGRNRSHGNGLAEEGDLHGAQARQNPSAHAQRGDLRHVAESRNGAGRAGKGDLHCDDGSQNGLACAQKGDLRHGASRSAFAPLAEKGDQSIGGRSQNPADLAQGGDLRHGASRSAFALLAEEGDQSIGEASQNPSDLAQKGDCNIGQERQNAEAPAQKGDFGGESGKDHRDVGDFEPPRPASSLNDNVITYFNDKTKKDDDIDIDAGARYSPKEAGQVGRQLALFLEKSPKNTGGFVVKCKACSRIAIRAAVIDVLVHQTFPTADPTDLRGRPRSAAKWFHETCKRYAEDETAIPAFVMRWVKTDLSWAEIAEQLHEAETRYQRYMIQGSIEADLVRAFLRGGIEQSVLDEQLQAAHSRGESEQMKQASEATPAQTAAPQPNVAEKSWMDEYEAQALAQEILRDASVWGVTAAVPRAEHGVSVVAVIWGRSRMTMKTPQQWRTHFADVLPLFEQQKKLQQQKDTEKE